MKQLTIYEFQAKSIENALRLCSNVLNSQSKETCLDRQVIQALKFIRNSIAGTPEKQVKYI